MMIYVHDFNFANLVELKQNSSLTYERTTDKNKYYTYELACSFDIETSSVYIDNGETKSAFMYIWMVSIESYTIYGRNWKELQFLMNELSSIFELDEYTTLIMYVHNLSYEFQFMRKYFEWVNVFAIDERKPIKARIEQGIEFKDSYILSGMGLEKTAENLTTYKIQKMVGDLDYSKIRTEKTPLTDLEIGYCENDVLIIVAYIKEQIELYGSITKIPLTNTGKVRKFVREKCYFTNKNHKKSNTGKYKRYRKLMQSLTLSYDEYVQLKRAFMGGFTHANAVHQGKVLEQVGSVDFTSSYPSVMLSEKFPMSKAFKIEPKNEQEFEQARQQYLLVFDVQFKNIISKITFENYLSESKCYQLEKPIVNNGRIFSADSLITTITNIDLDIIEQAYSFDSMEVKNILAYHKSYLPKPIIESVLELYKDKTQLKGVQGKEVEYMVSKGMINSTYGMTVTDIIQELNTYNNVQEWFQETQDFNEQIEKYNNGKSRFLFYPWGIFITAYARRNLWSGILSMKDDYVYSDTDSIKCLNFEKHLPYIEKYNELIFKKFELVSNYHNLDLKDFSPKTIKGIEKPLGVWDYEGTYSRFKTLGAKRYLLEEDGHLEITVAGLSKKNGLNYMIEQSENDYAKVFEMFNNDLYIPSDKTGKNTHTYIDDFQSYVIVDYLGKECRIEVESSVHLEKCDFTLSIAKEYGTFLNNLRKGYLYKGVTGTL